MATLEELRTAKTNALDELRKKRDDINKQLQEQAKTLFLESAKSVFENHPDLKSFSWTQYTPYFNDGDTCEFSAHTDDPYIQYRL